MSICRQIRLVLWKNFTFRRRRWARVRTRNLTFYYDACYNDPQYLGSTGCLPALQSYICQWNNRCHNQSKTVDEFNENSSLWKQILNLAGSLSIILNNNETSGYLRKLFFSI
ncbi:unnamed protein product [Rotaria sordida]|uniref:Uncharacterized protein n=2 Tax=Rotaria sordida TaxID=392033 RepID=A0A819NSG6_9BILA|nr:unnamed protein product [Rotaria sordida]